MIRPLAWIDCTMTTVTCETCRRDIVQRGIMLAAVPQGRGRPAAWKYLCGDCAPTTAHWYLPVGDGGPYIDDRTAARVRRVTWGNLKGLMAAVERYPNLVRGPRRQLEM